MNQQNHNADPINASKNGSINSRANQSNWIGLNRIPRSIVLSISVWIGIAIPICSFCDEIKAQDNPSSKKKQATRVLYVPFENLNILFDGSSQHVYLSKKEYEELLAKSETLSKTDPDENAPREFVHSSVDHQAEILGSYAVINTKLSVETFRDGLHAVPIEFKNVSIQSATIGDKSAPLGKNGNNQTVIFLAGKSIHEVNLQFVSLAKMETARQSVGFQLPTAATSKFSISVSGNVELTSGPAVVSRAYDAANNQTTFQLVPSRDYMSITMSVNNKKLQAKKSILAKSVVIHELTSNYEQIHARVNVDILYGSTNEVRFGLPKDFQITEVSCADMSQWRIEKPDADSILVVQLRTDVSKSFALNIAATSTKITPEKWTLNRLKPIGFDGELSVIGIVAEEQFELQSLSSTGLVSLDNQKIQKSIPETVFKTAAGAPAIETVAAYFSPDGNFELNAEFTRPEAKLVVKPTSILFLSDQSQKVIGQFQLTAENEKVIDFDLLLPADWRLMSITGGTGSPLSFQRFTGDAQTRINAKLPGGLAPGASNTIVFEAQMTSDEWSSTWSETDVEFPKFEVSGSELTTGAIAVAVEDDLAVRPKATSKLETLLKEQKSLFGLEGFNTAIAYEIVEADFNATLVVQRLDPQITATTYSFFQQKTKQLDVRYEIAFDIQTARARELKFSLPKTTPSELRIQGLNGVVLSQTDSTETDDSRVWTLKLSEPLLGEVRVSVDFVQPLESEEVKDYQPPMITLNGVEYQTSLFAFEGNPDFDIELKTAMRPIDVGEMGDSEYVPGSRLLGSYSSVGIEPDFSIDVTRRNIHQLPSAIVEKSALVSVVSRNGRSQTEAKYTILTKVPFLELKLPESAELWSVMLDGVPTRPQVRGDSIVISMPPDTTRRTREVSIFYEDEIAEFGLSGKIEMQAPILLVRNDTKSEPIEVPQADIDWSVTLPTGYAVASNDGSVFTTDEERKPLPYENVLAGVFQNIPNPFFMPREASYKTTEKKESKSESAGGADFMDAMAEDESPAGGEASVAERGMGIVDEMGIFDETESTRAPSPQTSQPNPPNNDPPFRDRNTVNGNTYTPPASLPAPTKPAKKLAKTFALKGKRGLNIQTVALSFEEETQTFNFKSLGAKPNVAITIVDQDRFHWLSFAYGGLVIAIGLMLCVRSIRAKIGFTMIVVGIAAAVPMLGDWTQIVWRGLENSLYAVCFLIFVWIAYAIFAVIVRFFGRDVTGWFRRIVHTGRIASLLIFVLSTFILNSGSELNGQDNKTKPVQIPSDAIIIPYDPENPDVESEQIFIPYEKYMQLKKQADPNQSEPEKPLVADFGWSGAEYKTTLVGSDLLINGKLRFETFTDKQIAIPLDLESAVITKASLDGKPAQLKVATSLQVGQALIPQQESQQQSLQQVQQKLAPNGKRQQPATNQKQLLLYVEGKGVKTLELEFRLPIQQTGGWRMVNGRLPVSPASKIEIVIPEVGTELNYKSNNVATEFVSTAAIPNLTIPLGTRGEVAFSWRGKITSAQVDQNLSVNSTALFDVRNDGLHLVWNLDFLFRASTRTKFDVELPKDFSVVRVYGTNIRGWEVRNEETINILDVTLLSEADSKESFTIELSNRKMDLKSATSFPMPTVVVPDAAIHSGQITVRKTSSLELQTDTMIGISRIDLSSARQVKPKSEPLFQPIIFQAFEFSRTPFSVAIQCRPKLGGLEVKTRTLIDIREKTCGMETQFVCSSLQPIHELTIELPADLDIQNISIPVDFRKTIKVDGEKQLLKLFLSQGLDGTFAFDISGRLADHQANQDAANPSSEIPLPKISVQNAVKQSGQFAAIAESRLIVQPAELSGCESVLVSQIKPWLSNPNKPKAQVAINHKSDGYDGKLKVTKKPAIVDATSITNVNVTLRSIEESIIINYEIRDNGIDEIAFLIPAQIKDARIKADLIREKSIEPVGDDDTPSQYRVTLKLQDLVTGQFRVLVEKDFGLSSAKKSASIPTIENVDSSKRYVTLQNNGFDELLVPDTSEMENLDRRQKPFRDLKELAGGADIRRGFLANATAQAPVLTYQTNPRKLVETVGASIGLSEIKMSIDRAGAYRVEQKLFVDNRTEPFLEIKFPSNARLWTVKVAESLVKPIAVESNDSAVRIPLIKTAEGDSDFLVEIKYGGSIGRLSNFTKIKLPFAETVGIKVSESNVRLYVPEDFDFDFNEASSLAISEEKRIAEAKSKYEVSLFSKLNSQARNSKSEFVKQRAIRNLKELQSKQEQVSRSGLAANSPSDLDLSFTQDNFTQDLNLSFNQSSPNVDNRGRFNELLQSQKVELFGNSGNLSNTYGGNWKGKKGKGQPMPKQSISVKNNQDQRSNQTEVAVNDQWFQSNGLVNPELLKQNRSNKRFNSLDFVSPAQKPGSGKLDLSKKLSDRESNRSGRKSGEMGGNGFGRNGPPGLSSREDRLQNSFEGLDARNELAQENFKKQIADNINTIQRQSQGQQGQAGANSKDKILRRYSERGDRGGQNEGKSANDGQRQDVPFMLGGGVNSDGKYNGERRMEPGFIQAPIVGGGDFGLPAEQSSTDFVSASLDLEFDHRGKEILFRTTSNELNLEATVISQSLKRRSTNFFVLLGVMVVLGFGFWFCKPKRA